MAPGGDIALAQPIGLHESAAEEVERLHRMASGMGLEFAVPLKVSKKYHGKAGTPVTSNQRAHHSDLDRNGSNDTSQPRKGGRPFPGVPGGIYDSGGLGAPEQIKQPVLSDHGRVRGVREPYSPPRGRPQDAADHGFGMTAGGSDDYDSGEYYESGDPETILARHGY